MRSSAQIYRINSHADFYCREPGDDPYGKPVLSALSDRELLGRLDLLNQREKRTAVRAIFHIAEIDERKLYLERGFSSMFEYCTGHLGYSRTTAGRRVAVGRCIRKHPEAGRMLESGETTPYIISLIAGIIDESDSAALLGEIRGRTTGYVEGVLLRKKPMSRVRDRIKKIYIKTEIKIDDSGDSEEKEDTPITPGTGCGKDTGEKEPLDHPEMVIQQVLEEMYKFEFAVDAGFREKFEKVKSLLSTKHPQKLELGKFFEILMDEYIDRHSPEAREKRRAERKKKDPITPGTGTGRISGTSRKSRGERDLKEDTRHISQALKDRIYLRDGGRCAYISRGGRKCSSRHNLQVDHIVPFALGGTESLDNLQLLCQKHNLLKAEHDFGKEFMKKNYKRE